MRTANVLISATHIFLILLMFAIGLFFIIMPSAPDFCSYVAKVILFKAERFRYIGGFILLITFLLAVGFAAIHKAQYIKIKMKPYSYSIDSQLIKEYIQTFWNKTYPENKILAEVIVLPKQKLEIIANLSKMSDSQKEAFLEKSNQEISRILCEHLKYYKEFILTLSSR